MTPLPVDTAGEMKVIPDSDSGHSVAGVGTGSYGEWRHIDSAPKDGTRILVLCAHGGIEITEWFEIWWDQYEDAENGYYRKVRVKTAEGWNSNYPTHWMPLPPVPASLQEEAA